MGTNYYLKKQGDNHCDHCGRSDGDQQLHIGKSSAGWVFSLHVMPELGINDLDDWMPLFTKFPIENEYGEAISAEDMVDWITNRGPAREFDQREWRGYCGEAHFHDCNHSERGPKGLLRHQLDGHCVKHGSGTWDCITGEFS